jgi:SAM-dependent methyltransferase
MNQKQLIDWYKTPLGKEFAKIEHDKLTRILTQLPGNYLLQLGDTDTSWLTASRVMCKYILGQQLANQPAAIAAFNELPFPNELFDIVILPHVLECSDKYPIVLREAARVMAGEGYLLVLGFSPYSLRALSKAKPPVTKLPSLHNLRYWLNQANCEVEQVNTFFFRPLLQQEKLLSNLQVMEKIGQLCWPGFGSCYLLIARKKIPAITPLNEKIKNWWHYLTVKPMVEPTTRNHHL